MLRVLRDDRQRHDFGFQRLCCHRLLFRSCRYFCLCGLHGSGDLRFPVYILQQALFQIAQHCKAGLGVVEHVPGLGTARFHRFHVVLNTDDCIR